MPIRIYNTLHRKKETFQPLEPGKVGMYVCGPTVYDSCHVGHARSAVIFDVICRYFKAKGFKVTYVRNFTDVDDKIINRANKLNIDSMTVAEQYIAEFYEDMDALYIERATVEPKVTEHIHQIIDVIDMLIKKGLAYQVDGNVYYAVTSFEPYGKLSGRNLDDMKAGARVNIDKKKSNPFDFALWKASKPNEPSWDSPWGKGRPGWHIECSAMSHRYLGENFDIHGGGKDLIFPHHENEIAQSEGAFEKKFANYWIHNGFVNINQEKMSKSLGNFLLIRDVLKHYHPEVVRLFLLSKHYRKPIDFSDANLKEADSGLNKIYTLLKRIEAELDPLIRTDLNDLKGYWYQFCTSMDDDFNTARGVGILFEAVRQMNRWLDEGDMSVENQKKVLRTKAEVLQIGTILGLLNEPAQHFFERQKAKRLQEIALDSDQIKRLIKAREEARKNKDWEKSDKIRAELEMMNVFLEDRPDGTVWKIKE